jgi:UDP-N-acetyl-D-mannosaminuronate dehydrogenase
MTIGFIGLGKLGLDCAEVFTEHYTVRGFDIYPRSSEVVQIAPFGAELAQGFLAPKQVHGVAELHDNLQAPLF